MKILNSDLLFNLSQYNYPISTMFEKPKTAKDWKQYIHTGQQVNSFKHNGFANGINPTGYYRQRALKTFPSMPQDEILISNFLPLLFDAKKERNRMPS